MEQVVEVEAAETARWYRVAKEADAVVEVMTPWALTVELE